MGEKDAPIRPIKLIDASWTFSCRFRRMGVIRGRRSLTGGFICVIPTTLAMAVSAAMILRVKAEGVSAIGH